MVFLQRNATFGKSVRLPPKDRMPPGERSSMDTQASDNRLVEATGGSCGDVIPCFDV